MTNPEETSRNREYLIRTYGLYPVVVRAFIEDTFRQTPEELLEEGGLASHKNYALLKIAVGEEPVYLLEEAYENLREEFEENERKERESQGYGDVQNILTETDYGRWRPIELREESEHIRDWYLRHRLGS